MINLTIAPVYWVEIVSKLQTEKEKKETRDEHSQWESLYLQMVTIKLSAEYCWSSTWSSFLVTGWETALKRSKGSHSPKSRVAQFMFSLTRPKYPCIGDFKKFKKKLNQKISLFWCNLKTKSMHSLIVICILHDMHRIS